MNPQTRAEYQETGADTKYWEEVKRSECTHRGLSCPPEFYL